MDPVEQLVDLYLRLNGFFTLTNYLLHDPALRTDVDSFGVRFPFKREMVAGKLLEDDPALELGETKIDVLLGEVGRNKSDFYKSWRDPKRMMYVIDFLGFLDGREEKETAADQLASLVPFEDQKIRVRPMLFTGSEADVGLTHRRLQDVMQFVVNRFRENERLKAYRPQWTATFAGAFFDLVNATSSPTLEDLDRIITRCELRDHLGRATTPLSHINP